MHRFMGRSRAGRWAMAKNTSKNLAFEPSPLHTTAPRKIHNTTPTPSSKHRNNRPNLRSKCHPNSPTQNFWDTGLPSDSELFNFTRGRFVIDEQYELSQRNRTFNVTELARHVAKSVQADRCLSIRKLPDGMFNKILLLSMDNGKQVVAKIPNPNTGQPHLTTASEVATMKFVSPSMC
jgi:hypothetical protein